MKTSHIFAIVSAVYIAPHVSPMVGIAIGIYLSAISLYHAWKEA